KARGKRRAIEVIEGAVEHFALWAEALLANGVGRPEGADQDIALNRVEIDGAGEEAMKDSADAADFLDGFVGDVDDGGHGVSRLKLGEDYAKAAIIKAFSPDATAV